MIRPQTMKVITIHFPEDAGTARVNELQTDLLDIEGVAKAGSDTTRSIGVADVAMWVGFAADFFGVATVAAAAIMKIVDRVRKKGIRHAVIELPNGAKISLDSTSTEEIVALVSALKPEEGRRSRREPARQ